MRWVTIPNAGHSTQQTLRWFVFKHEVGHQVSGWSQAALWLARKQQFENIYFETRPWSALKVINNILKSINWVGHHPHTDSSGYKNAEQTSSAIDSSMNSGGPFKGSHHSLSPLIFLVASLYLECLTLTFPNK